jgi:CRP/FNR family transcriptional regulator
MPTLSHIENIPLFNGLPREQMEDLSTIAVKKAFSKGETVFSEGEEGTGFYVVITGRVKIYKLSPDGKEQILHIFGIGEPFGEVPVFAGENFPANAETLEASTTLFFPRLALLELIKQNPSFALNLLAILSRRLRSFAAQIEDLSLKEVPGRIAAHLLYLSEQKKGSTNLELTITKGQLASLLGTIPETLSRILGRMSGEGLISSKGPRIKLLDIEGLKTLADSSGRL